MKNFLFLIILLGASAFVPAFSQEKPKLVVGVIVDQMRHEYLHRFEDKFSDGGFKRLIKDGYNFENAHFNYMPTKTAPGHASVYSGATPAVHGVIGNDWYDKYAKREIYCAGDDTEETVGSATDKGKMSPRNMLTTSITDELQLSTQKRAKVIGISLKDRGAIFPAGHLGQAYWYDSKTGDFITSTYYEEELSSWVKNFNSKKRADYYLTQTWETLRPIETYTESGPDMSEYERKYKLKEEPVFPYQMKKDEYWMLTETPYGNEILTELALQAIDQTDIGMDEVTDFLAISFSAVDYIGHTYGPNSKEIQDAYIRLDLNIQTLLNKLDEIIGKNEYMVFLTADHAVAQVPKYLVDNKIPAGYFDKDLFDGLAAALNAKYGQGIWIEYIINEQIFLNHELIKNNKLSLQEIQDFIVAEILNYEGIANAYPAHMINSLDYNSGGIKGELVRGYNQKRSGDVLYVYEPAWMRRSTMGSTHHSPYTYDTHVPMIFFGNGVKQGKSYARKTITQIAPTLAMMLGITLPNGATGDPLLEILSE